MSPLEKLFRLELEFHRRLRTAAPGTVTARQIEQLRERLTLASDTRDLLAAHDSLKQLLGLPQLGG